MTSSNGQENNLKKIEFNGREADEMTICALYAGSLGVPTICASGENSCFKRLKQFIPDLHVKKDSRLAMKQGLDNIDKIMPITIGGKIKMTFHFGPETLATMHARLPNVTKTGKRTTVVHAKNINEAFDAYCSCGLVASVDWLNNPNVHKSCRK